MYWIVRIIFWVWVGAILVGNRDAKDILAWFSKLGAFFLRLILFLFPRIQSLSLCLEGDRSSLSLTLDVEEFPGGAGFWGF